MRTLAGIIALAAAAMTIACGSGGGAKSTAIPRAASPTTAATAAASPTSAASASPQPTIVAPTAPPVAASTPIPAQPTKTAPPPAPRPTQAPPPPPPPPPPPSGVTLDISADNLQFSPSSLTAPAGAVVTIAFNNAESGVPHDIDVFSPSGASVGKTDVITGPAQATVSLGALAAGTYPFKCDVHPFMRGTLAVR